MKDPDPPSHSSGKWFLWPSLMLAHALAFWIATASAADDHVWYHTDKPIDEVIYDLEYAASMHNFVLVGRHSMSDALRHAGVDHPPPSLVLQMCQMDAVREVLGADPSLIRYMPCRVAVYLEGDQVVVTTLLLPEDSGNSTADEAARRLNDLMKAIMRYGVEP
jgi:uncharacterized protein (DUF302 family)